MEENIQAQKTDNLVLKCAGSYYTSVKQMNSKIEKWANNVKESSQKKKCLSHNQRKVN